MYKYRVNGREYTNDNFMYNSPRNLSAIDAASLLKNLQPGDTFMVYYNSDKPTESYVFPGIKEYTGMIIGAVIFLLGLALLFMHARSLKKSLVVSNDYEVTTRNGTNLREYDVNSYDYNNPNVVLPEKLSQYKSYLSKLY